MDGRFNPDNPTRYPEYPRLEVISNSGTPNTVTSSFWTLDASYLRIKNMQIGYSLPEKWLKPIRVSRTRVYASAENILTFGGGTYYPILRTITFGINLKL